MSNNKANDVKTLYAKYIEDIKKSNLVKEETFDSFFNVAKTTYKGLANFSLSGGRDNVTFKEAMDKKRNGS